MSVPRAQSPARGMSRTGSCDSSAASGSSSMPRKSHMANGIAKRIGSTPCGRKRLWPGSGSMSKRLPQSIAPLARAMTAKSTSTPMEMTETTMANFREIAAPAVFSPTKAAYRMIHQSQVGRLKPISPSVTPFAYPAEK